MKRRVALLITLIILPSLFFYGCVTKKNPKVETTVPSSEEINNYDAQIDWGNGHIEESHQAEQTTEASKSNIPNVNETEDPTVWTATEDSKTGSNTDASDKVITKTEAIDSTDTTHSDHPDKTPPSTESVDNTDDVGKNDPDKITSWTEAPDEEATINTIGEAIIGIGNIGSGGEVEWE